VICSSLFSQFVSQNLNINAPARATGCQFTVDHDCRNGSNAELLGTRKDSSVHHILHGDLGRRTGLLPHYVNYLLAERASRTEHFDFSFSSHWTLLPAFDCLSNLDFGMSASVKRAIPAAITGS
jgi:hypothetical protein